MIELRSLLHISRPRFWIYLFGPYIVGAAAVYGATVRLDWFAVLFGLYFLFPANLLVYGVNDIADYETDKLNPKKTDYESLVEPESRWRLAAAIFIVNAPFAAASAIFRPETLVPLAAFWFLSLIYSLPPIRAKSVPFLDSAFNVLYIFPAIFAFKTLSGNYPTAEPLVAGGLWTAAMHAYSAVPDIDSDRRAGVRTIATVLGPRTTLILCGMLYAASAALSFRYLSYLGLFLGTIYVLLMLASIRSATSGSLFNVYKLFPVINAAAGFLIFWYAVLNNAGLK